MTAEPTCAKDEVPLEIGVPEANDRRAENELWFLDVRENSELQICHLQPDGFIPLGELEERWTEIPGDREVVAYCHHGMRSLAAAKFLRARGVMKARSLKGGIEQWSREIDPTVPRY